MMQPLCSVTTIRNIVFRTFPLHLDGNFNTLLKKVTSKVTVIINKQVDRIFINKTYGNQCQSLTKRKIYYSI